MSNILLNSLLGSYSSTFDYSAIAKKKSSSEQGIFNVNNQNKNYAQQENIAASQKTNGQGLFEQNLYEASINNNTSYNSAPDKTKVNGPLDKNAVFQEKFKTKLAENGNDLTGAMEYAKEETFKLIFAQELERNGGNVNAAIAFASLGMGMSDKELVGALEDLAKEFSGVQDIEKALEDAITALDKKISMEDASAKLKDDDSNDNNSKSNSNNDSIADTLMYYSAQNKANIDNKNNKQNVKLYEAMLAENATNKSMNANNREPLDIMV